MRQLRECPKLGIIADGARKVDIRSVEEIYNVLRCGEEKRVKGETKLNAASSRSVEHVKLYCKVYCSTSFPPTPPLRPPISCVWLSPPSPLRNDKTKLTPEIIIP